MKNLKLLTISILPIMWSLYFLFEIFTGRVNDLPTVLGNLLLIGLFALVGYLFFYIGQKHPTGFTNKQLFNIFIFLILLDQGGKLLIKFFFFNDYVEIIKGFLSFNPIINTDGSWLNARFGTGVSFPFLISINFIALILFFELFRYFNSKHEKNYHVDMAFLFVFTGALCSLIDKVFYGGSLDFIGISNLFIADVKDIYINLGILFFIIALVVSGYLSTEDNSTFKDDLNSIRSFILFSIKDIFSIFKK